MKRSEIKRRALFDTVIANLEVELKEYRELDGNGLYIRVKPDSKWSWLGIGAYPERASAGKKAREIIKDISHGENLIVSKQERNRLVRNNAHWYFSHRIFKSLN